MIFWGLRKGERLHAIQIIGLVAALGGLVVLMLPGITAPPLIGSLLMLSAGVAWGIYSLRGKGETSPASATAGNFLRAVPFAVLVSVTDDAATSLRSVRRNLRRHFWSDHVGTRLRDLVQRASRTEGNERGHGTTECAGARRSRWHPFVRRTANTTLSFRVHRRPWWHRARRDKSIRTRTKELTQFAFDSLAHRACLNMPRCPWAATEPNITYHDEEWGVPVHDDRKLFEFLILEGAQAGLSWTTILKKRENYRKALDGFRPEKIARYGARDVKRLLADPGIVRNKLKIAATIQNAKAFLAVQKEFGTFDAYLWSFVGGKPKQNRWRKMSQVPARTKESDAMSRDLLRRGFKFAGSTICYALMQAVGMVNDHLTNCPRHAELGNK